MAKSVLNNPQEFASRWVQGMTNATEKIKSGIMRVQQAPGLAAAEQKSAYLAGVQRSQDLWAQNVAKVSLSQWQQAAATKGVDRIAQGASQAEARMQSVGSALLPQIQNIVSTLPKRGSPAQNRSRMNAFFDAMTKLKGTITR